MFAGPGLAPRIRPPGLMTKGVRHREALSSLGLAVEVGWAGGCPAPRRARTGNAADGAGPKPHARTRIRWCGERVAGRSKEMESTAGFDCFRPSVHVQLAIDGSNVGLEGVKRDIQE